MGHTPRFGAFCSWLPLRRAWGPLQGRGWPAWRDEGPGGTAWSPEPWEVGLPQQRALGPPPWTLSCPGARAFGTCFPNPSMCTLDLETVRVFPLCFQPTGLSCPYQPGLSSESLCPSDPTSGSSALEPSEFPPSPQRACPPRLSTQAARVPTCPEVGLGWGCTSEKPAVSEMLRMGGNQKMK